MKKLLTIAVLLFVQSIYLYSQDNEAPEPPGGYRSEATLKIAYFFGWLKLAEKMPEVPKEIIEYKDLTYKQIGDRSLKLDIYHQKNLTEAAPVLVFIHGGGWRKGDKVDYRCYLVDFAQRGYVTATLSYRFSQEAPFPAAVNDVKCAIRWLKTHANEYFINPEKVAVIGGSAGGHLAMMIGYSSDVPELDGECVDSTVNSRVQAVVNLYGPSDLTTDRSIETPSVKTFIGKPADEALEDYKKASPITYLTEDDPPTLIFHGTLDKLVPVEQSDKLKAKLDKVGISAEYHKLKGWPHTMDMSLKVNEYCQYYMNKFFEKYVPK